MKRLAAAVLASVILWVIPSYALAAVAEDRSVGCALGTIGVQCGDISF